MSAEPRRVATPDVWTRWEGQLVKGIFPLRRFLGCSDQSAVFLSEYSAGKTADVAIKLVPAFGPQAEARLAHWRAAFTLSHRHLVRLFDMGRCQMDGREFVFVVMEYGEQTLAEFLALRPLTAGEVRALLLPALDALAFLHVKQLVHAGLRPSNFLVVNDRLKLSSDSVCPAAHRGVATADDICSLGMTVIEAFTQRTPASPDAQDDVNALLANVPGSFANIVRRCLNPSPSARPTVAELRAQFKSARPEPATADDRPHASPWLLAIPAVLLLSLTAWISRHLSAESAADLPPPAVPTPAPAPAPAPTIAQPAATQLKPPVVVSDLPPGVVREVIPDVSPDLLSRIEGSILVTVRVLVDSSGNVMAVLMEKAGPSSQLANLADSAAREWKFAPAENQTTRVWILTFDFSLFGVIARASAV